MEKQTPQELIDKYLSGKATIEEKVTLESWYLTRAENIKDLLPEPDYARLEEEMWPVINEQAFAERKRIRLWPRVVVAAAALAAITLGVWLYYTSSIDGRHSDAGRNPALAMNDIAPGKNGATITLANGKVIQLSDAKSGVVIGSEVSYSDGSDVRYSSGSRSSGSLKGSQSSTGPVGVRSLTPTELQGADGEAQILTASTAKGQTYQFTLPDGTKVWLNADSKLEFPSNFNGIKERNVKLYGEGYFEVVKDKAHPFIVATDKQKVEVLGTHFNINSYADEGNVKTTLLEGSVKVSSLQGGTTRQPHTSNEIASIPRNDKRTDEVVLGPNQQAVVTKFNRIDVNRVDVNDVVAWKNGKFVFVRENVRSIMNKIARWYDVQIIYEGDVKGKALGGSVSRFKNVSEVLEMLSATKAVQFRIEGRKVIVMPFKE